MSEPSAPLKYEPTEPDPYCERCGGPAGEGGAWCPACIRECREYTCRLDFSRVAEMINSEPLARAAVLYARAGVPVLALQTGSKTPAIRRGLSAASTNPEQVATWWAEHPDHNIGLRTGSPFGDVLDVDCKHGAPGWESHRIARGSGLMTARWAVQSTPTRGLHVLFAPSGLANTTRAKIGMDVRGAGGYIVAAPSVTAEGRYRWEVVERERAGEPLPWASILDVLDPQPTRGAYRVPVANGDLSGLLAWVTKIIHGNRDNAIWWAAVVAIESGADPEIVHEPARLTGQPEWEINRAIRSARRHKGRAA